MENGTHQTDYRFKLLYAIGMVLIVAGHAGGGISLLNDWVPHNAYHIGLFVFASGYFFRTDCWKSPVQFVRKKFCSLLVPYFAWNVLYAGIALLLAHLGFSICGSADNVTLRTLFVEPFITGHQYGLNLAGWFVAPLFLSQMWALLTRMAYHGRRSNLVWFAVGLLMGVCSVLLSNGGMHKGGWLTLVHFLYFVMFYEAGNYYRTTLERHDTLSNDTYFALLFSFWMLLLIVRGAIPWSSPAFGTFTHNALLVPIVAFSGIAFWLRVAKVLEPSMGRSRIVNLVADSTFSIMINHLLGFFLLSLAFYTVSQHTSLLHGFDTVEWHNNIWYTYLPRGLWRTHLLYVVAGIAFGVGIQQVLNFAKRLIGARKA